MLSPRPADVYFGSQEALRRVFLLLLDSLHSKLTFLISVVSPSMF